MPVDFSPTLIAESRCTIEEQIKLFPLIQIFMECSRMCALQGSLSLEEFAEKLGNAYPVSIKLLLDMLVFGYYPSVILEVGFHMALRKESGYSLLKHLVILEGIDCIAHRKSPLFIRNQLHSLLDGDLRDPEKAVGMWKDFRKKNQIVR